MRSGLRRFLLGFAYTASLAAIAVLAYLGRSFYATSLGARPHHALYWRLKPGGSEGHLLGLVGSALLVLMLLYSLRKRWRRLGRLGPLPAWLDFHIYCGVVGPLLIVLHSAFKVHGLVALSFWSMVAVATSGVAGRYLYVQLPRKRSGDEMTLAEVEALNREAGLRLQQTFGLSAEQLAELDRLGAGGLGRRRSALSVLLRLPLEGLLLRRRLARFVHRLPGLTRDAVREIGPLLRQRVWLERRILLWGRLQELFHYWHVVHKPFAVVMYLFMTVHVAVALATGYGWGLGS